MHEFGRGEIIFVEIISHHPSDGLAGIECGEIVQRRAYRRVLYRGNRNRFFRAAGVFLLKDDFFAGLIDFTGDLDSVMLVRPQQGLVATHGVDLDAVGGINNPAVSASDQDFVFNFAVKHWNSLFHSARRECWNRNSDD
jgi:hypothetical protein